MFWFCLGCCMVRLVFWGFKLFQNGELRSPDIFQYFLNHFWNFENVHQILTISLLLYVGMLQQIQEKYAASLKLLFSMSQHFRNTKCQILLTLPDNKHFELIFNLFFVCLIWWVRKQLGSPSVFKEFCDGGILINI